MERKLLLSLMAISFLQMSTSLAFCQKGYCKVVGRYFVPKEVKSKQCTFENDFFEDYSIEFYPNCKFKYYSNNPLFGPSQTHGVWSLSESGDTITLDSGRKELSMESMGYFNILLEDIHLRPWNCLRAASIGMRTAIRTVHAIVS